MFKEIDENLDAGLLNTIFFFFLVFLLVEPNLAYCWTKLFGKCCKGGCLKESSKKYKKRKYSSSSSDSDKKKNKKNKGGANPIT